jgi:hypothetical protein
MAIYIGKDLNVQNNGDIVVNSRGDLEIAEAKDSHCHVLKFMMSTDLDEMRLDPFFGANLGALHGELDPAVVAARIPEMVREALTQQGLFAREDIKIRAFQIDTDNIVVFADVNGTFIKDDGTIDPDPTISLRFLFPYKEAELIALDEDD